MHYRSNQPIYDLQILVEKFSDPEGKITYIHNNIRYPKKGRNIVAKNFASQTPEK